MLSKVNCIAIHVIGTRYLLSCKPFSAHRRPLRRPDRPYDGERPAPASDDIDTVGNCPVHGIPEERSTSMAINHIWKGSS